MEIWLVRHGATEWSRSGRHTGRTDVPLLPEGEAEARGVGRRLGGLAFRLVVSSPLRRALDTARLAGFGDRIEVSDLLAEVDYGEYEGRTGAEIRSERPGWELFRDGAPGGETPVEIESRMARLLELIGDEGGDALLFGHGHCLRALAAAYLEVPISVAGVLRLDSGSLSVLGHEHDHRAISVWNQDCRRA